MCEATSTGHMEPPTTTAVPQPLQPCPEARAQCCPMPWLLGLRTHRALPPVLRPAGVPSRRVGVAVAAGARRDGKVHREEGRGRPTPPFRFPFLSFLTQRQRLCFLLQAAGPLPWGHPWPELAPGCGPCQVDHMADHPSVVPEWVLSPHGQEADPHTEPRCLVYLQLCAERGLGGKFTEPAE